MNNLNTLPGNEDIKDKIIFLKVDFNIPIKDGDGVGWKNTRIKTEKYFDLHQSKK